MAEKPTRLLLPAEEIEGDRQGTTDFIFRIIGESIRIKPTHSDSAFDLSNPPFQPLAVSEHQSLVFLAHSRGFLVADVKDVIGLAKSDGGEERCVQRACVVDVEIGRVSVVALSGDFSMLAAAVGGEIHLFYVKSLVEKVQEPAVSCRLKDSDIVQDLKWRRSSENSFVVLSGSGLLCCGSLDLQLKDVMDNVDAVDWSVDGNFVAIARKDTVSILSSNFEEVLGIPLLFQSWDVDSGSEIKVDSIKWVRHDSVVIGCTQLNEDGDEDGYLVQVITTGEHKLTEVSCKPVVFSFPDLFDGLSVDMLPTGVGPYLLADYLDCWDVAITSNKKNIDQHISLLRWLVEDSRYEVVSLDLGSDKYVPRIDLQDDGDNNLILGLAIDRSSLYEKIEIQRDMELKELSPRCILFCLTCDGKLTLHHAAWVSEPSDLPGDNIVNERFCPTISVGSELDVTTSRLKDVQDAAILGGKKGSDGTLDGAEPCSQGPCMITSSYSGRPAIEEPRMSSNAGDLNSKSTDNEMSSDLSMVKGTGTSKIVGSAVGSTFGSQTAQKIFGAVGSSVSASSTVKGTGTRTSQDSKINDGSSSLSQVVPSTFDTTGAKNLSLSPGDSNSAAMRNKVLFPSNSPANFAPFSKLSGTLESLEKINQTSMQTSSTKSGYTSSPPILHSSSMPALAKLPGSRQQFPLANSTSSKPHQRLEAESQFSKQFYNVKEMAKELDALLSFIECEGGFKDLCTVFQEKSLLSLEAGLDDFSELLFVYREKIENQRMEIQQLCNKMLEVSARQVYMKGIVQQASDHRYWAFWNSQKLSPKFEAKRLHISNLKQNLTNQLIELERHFNNLEINKFGEYNTPSSSWRAPRSTAPSKQTQSLHSLYSTVNSQLAAAEKLSEHLSKQIAALNISSPASEKQNVTKELFESIGLEPKTDAFLSPGPKSCKLLPYSSKRTSPSPGTTSKKQSWNCAPDAVKAFQLESVRRKRDSLNKNWAHFEPSKTTVKRTSDKELVRSNLEKAFREAKEVFDSQLKAFDNAPKPAGMRNFSIASSAAFDSLKQAVGIANRSSNGTASFLSNTAFNNSQSLEQSPIIGIQEKSSTKAIDAQPQPIFKWTKGPLDQRSERHSSLSSTSSHVSQSAVTQPFSFAKPSIFSSKDEKFDSPSISNTGASTSSQVPQIAGTQSFSFATPSIFSVSSSKKNEKFDSASISNTVASISSQVSNMGASTSMQVPQSAGAQPFSFATSSIFSNSNSNKDRKFDSASISNTGASSSSQVSNMGASTSMQVPQSVGAQPFSFATTSSVSKPTSVPTQMKFPGTVSPFKAASTVETTSQSNQSTGHENEVDTPSLLRPSNKNSTVPSSTLSASVAQTNALSTSSSVSSFQFGSSMQPNIFSTPSKSNAPFSLSTELNPKSMLSQARGPASEDSPLLNKSDSELEPATPQSTNNAAVNDSPKEVSSLPSKISSEVNFHLSASENVATSNTNISKLLRSTSQQIPATGNLPLPREESVPPSTTNGSMLPAPSGFLPVAGSVMAMSSSIMTTERDESLDATLSQEDEMEEEATTLDTNSMLNMESLGGFSSQSIASTAPKPNPFGSSFLPASSGGASLQLSWSSSSGQLFRPPSFNLPESQLPPLSQSTGSNSLTGSLSGGFSGFGQPAQLGAGQQALGSVLGSFGQSRQLGTGLPGFGFDSAAAGSSGGFSNSSGFTGGGFAGAATGGGFAGAASGGGFAGVPTGGGFAGAAPGGGFAGAASNIGGFPGAGGGSGFGGVSSGGGFGTGGFGGFSSFQGSGGGGGGFSAFGSGNSTAGRPPAELLTQMRK